MGEDSGEKTEEPTPHKLREARKKGQVGKSKDVTTIILLITSFYTLNFFAGRMWEYLSGFTKYIFSYISIPLTETVSGVLLKNSLEILLYTIGPMVAIVFFACILVELLQVGFLFSFEPLTPNLNKLNPVEGAKKFFQLKQYVELVKSVIKMFIVFFIIYSVIKEEFIYVLIAQQMSLYDVMAFTGRIVMKTITRIAIFFIFIAGLDFVYQRYEYIKGLKMTKKEVKDEYKRLEGDPLIKQRQRQTQREMSQGRQMGSVPGADVVVTNPIHIALAIKYTPNQMRAPILLAKGKRLVAQSIKDIANEHNIPIIEDQPLARRMYENTEVNGEIPQEYYKAVAEILAFVYKIKQKKKQQNNA